MKKVSKVALGLVFGLSALSLVGCGGDNGDVKVDVSGNYVDLTAAEVEEFGGLMDEAVVDLEDGFNIKASIKMDFAAFVSDFIGDANLQMSSSLNLEAGFKKTGDSVDFDESTFIFDGNVKMPNSSGGVDETSVFMYADADYIYNKLTVNGQDTVKSKASNMLFMADQMSDFSVVFDMVAPGLWGNLSNNEMFESGIAEDMINDLDVNIKKAVKGKTSKYKITSPVTEYRPFESEYVYVVQNGVLDGFKITLSTETGKEIAVADMEYSQGYKKVTTDEDLTTYTQIPELF